MAFRNGPSIGIWGNVCESDNAHDFWNYNSQKDCVLAEFSNARDLGVIP